MERTVKVTVLAQVTGALGQFAALRQGVRDFSSELQKAAVDRKATFNDIGVGLTAVGAVVGGITALAVKKFADFDQAMSHVAAVTRETTYVMGLLREAALQAGADTQFTALEAASAIEEMAKAGVSTSNILSGGLTASLNLAAASGLSVARSAEIAAGALGMFQLKGSDLASVTDYLAAGANKSIGEVDDLALALRQVGPVAFQTGLSIKETVGALAAFASTGRIGQDAGTSFKRMLQLLTPQSAQAEAEMNRLGISGYDATGHFIGLANYAGVLQEKLKDLTPEARNAAFAVMYGSDAVNAASEIYRQGKTGIQEWIDKVDDTGYAADNAAIRMGNLKGDIEQFGGSLDTLFVTMGEAANGPLRSVVQTGTDIVNALGGTSDEFQQSLFWATALTGGITLMGAAFFLGVPRVAAYVDGLRLLTAQFPKLGAAMGKVGRVGGWIALALTLITTAVTAMNTYTESLRMSGAEMENLVATSQDGANTIRNTFQNLEIGNPFNETNAQSWGVGLWDAAEAADNFGTVVDQLAKRKYNQDQGIFGVWKNIEGGQQGFDEAITRLGQLGDSFASLASSDLPAAQEGFARMVKDMALTDEQAMQLLDLMPAYRDALIAQATTLGIAADGENLLALAMGEGSDAAYAQRAQLEALKGAAADAEGGIADLAKQVSEFGKTQFDTNEATRKTEEAYLDLVDGITAATEAGNSYNDMLNIQTRVGQDVTADMDSYAASINNAAAAMYTQNGSIEEMSAYLEMQRQRLYEVAFQLYGNEQAAWDYVNALIATPADVQTNVVLNGIGEADASMRTWFEQWNGRTVKVSLDVNGNALVRLPGGGQALLADGGTVRGPGTSTSDSIPAWLSNGEEVINAASATKWRPLLKAINADRVGSLKLARGGTAGKTYASGYGNYASTGAATAPSGDTINWTTPVVPEAGQPIADQLFYAAKRLQVRLKSRRG